MSYLPKKTSKKTQKKACVIIRECEQYDVELIRHHIRFGLETLQLKPQGRVLIKPNVVASGEHFPHAYTRPEFTEGVALALKDVAQEEQVKDWGIGERCGITMPTRFAYRGAGYYPMAKRVGFQLYHFDEVAQVEVPMKHQERLRDAHFTPEPIARADFFVNCPKFKAHPWTTVTFSLKNYIGIQDDRHRLIDHDHRLNEKVADLQSIIQPHFIAIDAITAGEGRMLTPIPFDMGLIIMGNNQVAFDVVCCHIIGIDPMEVPHIRMCYERGFGPINLNEIEIIGDLEMAKQAAQGFQVGLVRVEEYFKESAINAYGGRPPRDGEDDYCWGGCPGALEEAIEILRLSDHNTDEKMPPMHIVFGDYQGDIPAQKGEKIIFIGDCAQYTGEINEQVISIESLYQDRSHIDPRHVKAEDIFLKMIKMQKQMSGRSDIIRLQGCPVSVAEQVLMLVKLGKLKNPYFDPKQAIPFVSCYLSWRTRQMLRKLTGKASQIIDFSSRGLAKPNASHPIGSSLKD
jgi:uncharacterized protein (DUF362 family)